MVTPAARADAVMAMQTGRWDEPTPAARGDSEIVALAMRLGLDAGCATTQQLVERIWLRAGR